MCCGRGAGRARRRGDARTATAPNPRRVLLGLRGFRPPRHPPTAAPPLQPPPSPPSPNPSVPPPVPTQSRFVRGPTHTAPFVPPAVSGAGGRPPPRFVPFLRPLPPRYSWPRGRRGAQIAAFRSCRRAQCADNAALPSPPRFYNPPPAPGRCTGGPAGGTPPKQHAFPAAPQRCAHLGTPSAGCGGPNPRGVGAAAAPPTAEAFL